MRNPKFINTLEWAVRLNVCIKLTTYGMGKVFNGQFYLKGAIPEEIAIVPLGETTSYNLAWTFFGHSKGYILFIGLSQVAGAILFLIPRTKLIGGSILLPILLNIIVVDYFYGVAYGALFSACFYLGSIIWVFWLERQRLSTALQALLVARRKKKRTLQHQLIWVLGVLALFGVVFLMEFYGIGLFGYQDR
ncbi:MAG: hypothetical protein R3359_06715 [Marinirhabdus sp.]|nr:hypothetical protein [Marinirhabdus sp.]